MVGIFDIVSLVCAIFSIIKFLFLDNFLTGLSFFSAGLWVLVAMLLIFHIEKLFDWYYKKAESVAMHARPEFFSTSLFLVRRNVAYKRLKLATLILLGINIILQVILLFFVQT